MLLQSVLAGSCDLRGCERGAEEWNHMVATFFNLHCLYHSSMHSLASGITPKPRPHKPTDSQQVTRSAKEADAHYVSQAG